jgi:hypothetical protein
MSAQRGKADIPPQDRVAITERLRLLISSIPARGGSRSECLLARAARRMLAMVVIVQ